MNIVGRKDEKLILSYALENKGSHFIAVVGRRRVGKTYLIEEFFKDHFTFSISGQKDFRDIEHKKVFVNQIDRFFPELPFTSKESSWLDLFLHLIKCLEQKQKRPVIFFDELPWLSNKRSSFLAALGYFWNEWARINNAILIVCGSAASWMIKNIVKEKGSLYNRMTKLIRLQPFTIEETKEYLEKKDIFYNSAQLIDIYLVLGGIPHYLNEVQPGLSAIQNIQNICFSKNGLLSYEYGNLYDALFDNSTDYKKIIEALFSKKSGLTKSEIALRSKLLPNGAFYHKIDELLECGFIMEVASFDAKQKTYLYRLIDEYSLFYHYFIKGNKFNRDDYWFSLFNTPSYHSWSGYAFENFCFRHYGKIVDALKISGMKTQIGSFYVKGNDDIDGIQIDMLIDRADQCLNLVECKYYKDHFYLSATEANNIRKRKALFLHHTRSKKQIFVTLISTGNLIQSKESIGLIDHSFSTEIFLNERN